MYFHPLVREWFDHSFASATTPQELAWKEITAGHDVLISAPTGSGKTLAAFLLCLDRLVRAALDGSLLDQTNVIYGRGMSDSNGHQPIGVPIAVLGQAFKGGEHVRHQGMPLTNLYMTVLGELGVPVERIGDSNGKLVTL